MPARKEDRRGFTLVEIMIVLAIVAMLMAMVGPRLLKSQEKADLKATNLQIKNLETALKQYYAENRHYPTTEEGLGALLEKPADEQRARNWDGPYIEEEKLPVDPWGNTYAYEFPPTEGKRKNFPNLYSFGPDGQEKTDDDIINWTRDTEGDVPEDEGLTAHNETNQ